MIAAIAKVNGATTVYSDDPGIAKLGKRYGFDVFASHSYRPRRRRRRTLHNP